MTTELIDTVNTFRSYQAALPKKGSWLCYKDVDFSDITEDSYLIISVKAAGNTAFCIREKSATGKVIAKIALDNIVPPETPNAQAGGCMMGRFRRDLRNQWLTQTAALAYVPKGVTDLVVTNEGDAEIAVDYVLFKNRPKYFSPSTAAPIAPDSEGFIHRWMLLEPINKPNSGNTVFTDSYLREHFNR